MMGLGKPKLYTKFEFASFNRCRNIKGNPLAQGHANFFFWWDLIMGLGKPQLHTKFEVVGFILC